MQPQHVQQTSQNIRFISLTQINIQNQDNTNSQIINYVQTAFLKLSKTLEKIKLKENKLQFNYSLMALPQYPQLIELDLCRNNVEILYKMQISKIKYLYLQSNQIQEFSIGINFPYLQTLNLKQNLLKSFSPIIAPNLKNLYLSCNLITSLQKFSQQEYPSLQDLFLDKNQITGILPRLKCPRLQHLDISQNSGINSIEEFCLDQYLEMKTFTLKNINRRNNRSDHNFQKLPYLEMPKLEKLVIQHAYFKNIKDFSQGYYSQLKLIEITKNLRPFVIHQLFAPKLRNLNIQNTMVYRITSFLRGNHPLLQKINISGNTIYFYQSLPPIILKHKINQFQDKNMQQKKNKEEQIKQIQIYAMENYGQNAYKLINYEELAYPHYKTLLMPAFSSIQVLKIHIPINGSISMIFQLNLQHITQIQILQNHYLTSTFKKLMKLNFDDPYIKKLRKCEINQKEKPNILTFFNTKSQSTQNRKVYGQVIIQRDEYWRRIFTYKDKISWTNNDNDIEEHFQSCSTSFEKRLLSYKVKSIKNIDLFEDYV